MCGPNWRPGTTARIAGIWKPWGSGPTRIGMPSWTPIWPRSATSGTRPPDTTSSGAAGAQKTPELLVKILKDPSTKKEEQPRYLRAFDFQAKSPEKDKALEDLLEWSNEHRNDRLRRLLRRSAADSRCALAGNCATASAIGPCLALALRCAAEERRSGQRRVDRRDAAAARQFDLDAKPKTKAAVLRFLKANPGSEQFFQLIERFAIQGCRRHAAGSGRGQARRNGGCQSGRTAAQTDDAEPHRAATLPATIAPGPRPWSPPWAMSAAKQCSSRLMPLVTDADAAAGRAQRRRHGAGQSRSRAKPICCRWPKTKSCPPISTSPWPTCCLPRRRPTYGPKPPSILQLPAVGGRQAAAAAGRAAEDERRHGPRQRAVLATATCSKCHIVDGQGKDVGPNLSEIGSKLGKDALLVAILDPSAGISHNYETFLAVTDDGKVISGMLVSKTDDEVVLKDAEAIVHTLKTGRRGRTQEAPHLADAGRSAKADERPGFGRRGRIPDDAEEAVAASCA